VVFCFSLLLTATIDLYSQLTTAPGESTAVVDIWKKSEGNDCGRQSAVEAEFTSVQCAADRRRLHYKLIITAHCRAACVTPQHGAPVRSSASRNLL